MNRAAAIDIGSNSILLTVVEKAQPLKVLYDNAFVVGLSKGMGSTGVIAHDRQEKALSAIEHCKELLDQYKIESLRVVATALRRRFI